MTLKRFTLLLLFLVSGLHLYSQNQNPFELVPVAQDREEILARKEKKKKTWSLFKRKKETDIKETKKINPSAKFTVLDSSQSRSSSVAIDEHTTDPKLLSADTNSIDAAIIKVTEENELQELEPAATEPVNISLPEKSINNNTEENQNNNPFYLASRAPQEQILNAQKEKRKEEANLDILMIDESPTKDTNADIQISDKNADEKEDGRVTVIYENLNKELTLEDHVGADKGNNIYLFWFLLIMTLACSIVVYLERTLISQIFRALNNNNFLDLLFRKRNQNNNIIYSVLYVLFFLNIGVFIYLVLGRYYHMSGTLLVLYAILGVTGIYLLKHFILLGIGWTFNIQRVMNAYSFAIIIFNLVLGIIFLPINYFVAFGSDTTSNFFIYIGLIAIVLFLIARSFRSVMMSWPLASRSKFHFILYLCTVELIPILVLWKLAAG